MMSIYMLMMMTSAFAVSSSKNPVKVSMSLLIFSSILFIFMAESMGSSWFPIIFLLLFMGGILILFMILSSILPNESSAKIKISYSLTIMMILTMSMHLKESGSTGGEVKWFLQNGSNMQSMTIIILLYFLVFIYIISNEKMPLRSSLCSKVENFVNFQKKGLYLSIVNKT